MALAATLWVLYSLSMLCLLPIVSPHATVEPKYVQVTIDGQQYRALDDRQPALYTADFGDCLGASAINVTRFDAAYYKDNMTILFHLEGQTALVSEDIMMSIGVHAYGETRFQLNFNPCSANIWSACPMRANTSIEAAGFIPVSPTDVSVVPDIALSIPDFEGQAILRIFSNSTETEIACFAAQITNGSSFRQNWVVGPILGVFTAVAAFASFVTAIYGDDVVEMRKHYAHSFSVMVVFAVWHHIYFTGALSMNWPSVLVAFWSNYAWTGGMIYSEQVQNTINDFIDLNKRNISQVGAAGTAVDHSSGAGANVIQTIYKRPGTTNSTTSMRRLEVRDAGISASSGFQFNGQPVKPGLPLPGNFSGFAGTLAQDRIPASNAFMTGLLWLLILVTGIFVTIIAFKLLLEALVSTKLMKRDHLRFFRRHYARYAMLSALRMVFIGFFMILFLSMFHISHLRSHGAVSIAITSFLIVAFGMGVTAGLTCFSIITGGNCSLKLEHLNIEKTRKWKFLRCYRLSFQSKSPRSEDLSYIASLPYWKISWSCCVKPVHKSEDCIKRYGWLTSRYRRTRWWFFVAWLVYEFVRASFLAGASNRPLVQVSGLLGIEIVAFAGIIYLRPFESRRLNVVAVYFLGFSKITTTVLSAAFAPRCRLSRMVSTIIGLVIIAIQGTLTVVVLAMIIVGTITSYMSVMRNRPEIRPKRWNAIRGRYFKQMDVSAQDVARARPVQAERSRSASPEAQIGPYFAVNHVRRMPKIEDYESTDTINNSSNSQLCLTEKEGKMWSSSDLSHVSYTALPPAARLIRPSWHSHEFLDSRRLIRNSVATNGRPSTPITPNHAIDRDCPQLFLQLSRQGVIERQSSPASMGICRSPSNVEGSLVPRKPSIRVVRSEDDGM